MVARAKAERGSSGKIRKQRGDRPGDGEIQARLIREIEGVF
jgi:hypothetical protein